MPRPKIGPSVGPIFWPWPWSPCPIGPWPCSPWPWPCQVNLWPWWPGRVILDDPERRLRICFKIYALLEPTTKIWMKIVSYCQRQRCSPMTKGIVYGNIRFMRIRVSSLEMGVKRWISHSAVLLALARISCRGGVIYLKYFIEYPVLSKYRLWLYFNVFHKCDLWQDINNAILLFSPAKSPLYAL